MLNSPANPSGHALTAEDFAAVAAAAARVGAWVIADEVYARLRFAGAHVSAWDHADPERVAVLGSLSKSHRMSGYRLGWVLGPETLIGALSGWSAAATFSVCQFVQDAGLAALALPDAALRPYWDGFASRAAMVAERAARIPGIALNPPAGGMFALLDVRALMADDLAFANALLDATGAAVLPGRAFGASAVGHVRVSLTAEAATLSRALDRLEAFAANLERAPRAA
jgi:arginine:pyruvate transaminase